MKKITLFLVGLFCGNLCQFSYSINQGSEIEKDENKSFDVGYVVISSLVFDNASWFQKDLSSPSKNQFLYLEENKNPNINQSLSKNSLSNSTDSITDEILKYKTDLLSDMQKDCPTPKLDSIFDCPTPKLDNINDCPTPKLD